MILCFVIATATITQYRRWKEVITTQQWWRLWKKVFQKR